MSLGRYFITAVGLCLALTQGCANTSDGPGRVATSYVEALQSSDASAVHALLDPAVVARIDRLSSAVKALRENVEKHYSNDDQKSILARTGLTQWPETSLDLLAQSSHQASEAEPLTALQQWGTGIRALDVSDDKATATTWGGDVILLRKTDERWLIVWGEEDEQRLESMLLRIIRVRDQVESAVQNLESTHRFGGAER